MWWGVSRGAPGGARLLLAVRPGAAQELEAPLHLLHAALLRVRLCRALLKLDARHRSVTLPDAHRHCHPRLCGLAVGPAAAASPGDHRHGPQPLYYPS